MDDAPSTANFIIENEQLLCQGDWTRRGLQTIINDFYRLPIPSTKKLIIQGDAVKQMDTSGAWSLYRFINRAKAQDLEVELSGFTQAHYSLLDLIARQRTDLNIPAERTLGGVAQVGHLTIAGMGQLRDFCNFFGDMFLTSLTWVIYPWRIRWVSLLAGIQRTGYNAMVIVALLSFLIGVVLTYQVGLQLLNYGANIFVVDLVGISLLREFAPLITAVILAGRTGSAYTAQIGTMKLNEEVDAIRTMGLSPMELLVLPKMFALLIAMPLLTILADIVGVLGGMFMAKGLLDVGFNDFIMRFGQVIDLQTFMLGLIKVPVFAVVIASIGCFQGFQVHGSAESVGERTTMSVVQGIFMIIVVDAAFSVFYGKLGI